MGSPVFLKKLYSYIPWPLRMGKTYRKTYSFLLESENWSQNQWHVYQTEKLKKLLQYCNEYIPYYQTLFVKHNLDPYSEHIWQEFFKIPYAVLQPAASKLQNKRI